jgi:hypothetical protein
LKEEENRKKDGSVDEEQEGSIKHLEENVFIEIIHRTFHFLKKHHKVSLQLER